MSNVSVLESSSRNPYLPSLRIAIIIMITSRSYTFWMLLAILDLFSPFESLDMTPLQYQSQSRMSARFRRPLFAGIGDRDVHEVPSI
jgi:hypothetical protein